MGDKQKIQSQWGANLPQIYPIMMMLHHFWGPGNGHY